MRIQVPVFLVAMMAVSGCGQEPKSSSSDGAKETSPVGGMTVADVASLPECTTDGEGALVFVKATQDFRACAEGKWVAIDLKGLKGDTGAAGAKGDAGEPGAAGAKGEQGENGLNGDGSELTAAIAIYQTARKSIFRVTTKCTFVASPPAGCPAGNTFLGSAFLCGDKQVCTNSHVAGCDATCFTGVSSIKLHQVVGATDSVMNGTSMGAPFFQDTDDSAISYHATKDLAIITLPANPADATPLGYSEDPASVTATMLKPTLSLSFPLGFTDLYVDVGAVNTPKISECDSEGGQSGYGCPKYDYDFSTSNDTDHGSSGSPIFDLKSGKVIGVTTAGTEGENANFTWAVDASLFKDVP